MTEQTNGTASGERGGVGVGAVRRPETDAEATTARASRWLEESRERGPGPGTS